MFTGIVEGQGTVAELRAAADGSAAALRIDAPWLAGQLSTGDSVAVNGCCVTVTATTGAGFAADLVAETLRRTALGGIRQGEPVNLERPLAADGRLGGHVVQGHVDGVGRVLARDPVGDGVELRVGLDEALARYVVVKGSIAVDGVSLTVMSMSTGEANTAPPDPARSSGGANSAPPDPARSSGGANSAPPDPPGGAGPDRPWFSVALVPHTLAVTTLGRRQPGDAVQLEVDVLAKYVERLLGPLVPDREV